MYLFGDGGLEEGYQIRTCTYKEACLFAVLQQPAGWLRSLVQHFSYNILSLKTTLCFWLKASESISYTSLRKKKEKEHRRWIRFTSRFTALRSFYLQFTPNRISWKCEAELLHSRVDTMAHRKRVWHVRIFPVDGHAVPGTLADHACTWAKKKKPRPKRRTRSLSPTGTDCPARVLATCSATVQVATISSSPPSNSTERNERSPRPSPRGGTHQPHTSADQIKILARAAAGSAPAPAVPKRLSSTQPTPSGALRSAHCPHPPACRGGMARRRAWCVMRAARFIRANHASCSLCFAPVPMLIFLGGCWPACLHWKLRIT